MDLSKALETLNHNLLITKLHAHCFEIKTLKLLHSYLTKRRQRLEQKQIHVLVHGQSCYMASRQVLFLGIFFSIFT